MLVFVLFAVINLAAGFACAVALGYGPRPWYALFLPSGGNSVVHIEAIEAESSPLPVEAESKTTRAAVEAPETEEDEQEDSEPDMPEPPQAVSEPIPEIDEPEEEPEPVEPEPAVAQSVVEDLPEEMPAPTAKAAAFDLDDPEHELEDYLAGRRDVEPEQKLPTSEPEPASPDDIAAMFAVERGVVQSDPPKAAAEPEDDDDDVEASAESDDDDAEPDDHALTPDDIAALFK